MDISAHPGKNISPENINIWLEPQEIDQDTRDKLWAYISEEINKILDKFYSRIISSEFRGLLATTDIELLKHKQINHWRRLIEYPLDAQYEARLVNMHANHLRIGLKRTQYIASYFFLMSQFQKAILRQAVDPGEAYELIVAINSIVADDISRALTVDAAEG